MLPSVAPLGVSRVCVIHIVYFAFFQLTTDERKWETFFSEIVGLDQSYNTIERFYCIYRILSNSQFSKLFELEINPCWFFALTNFTFLPFWVACNYATYVHHMPERHISSMLPHILQFNKSRTNPILRKCTSIIIGTTITNDSMLWKSAVNTDAWNTGSYILRDWLLRFKIYFRIISRLIVFTVNLD